MKRNKVHLVSKATIDYYLKDYPGTYKKLIFPDGAESILHNEYCVLNYKWHDTYWNGWVEVAEISETEVWVEEVKK